MKHLVRIATNYFRLIATIVLGVWLVRLLNGGVGKDGLAIFFLMGSSVGLASMIQDIVRQCMVRELGSAWHSEEPGKFATVFSSAVAVSSIIAVLAAGLLVLLAIFIELLEVPPYMVWPARIFVLAKAVEIAFTIGLAPAINMYLITERFVPFNVWMVMHRATYVVGAVWLFTIVGVKDAGEGLIGFGLLGTGIYIFVMVVNALMITAKTPDMIPALSRVSGASMKSILAIGGWNTSVVVANNLHLRADAIISNLFFGLSGSFVFGLAMQYTSYVRRLAVGLTDGLDAVSVRLSAKEEDHSGVLALLRQTTRLQSFVAIPCGIVTVYFAEPLLTAWLANRPDAVAAIPGVLTINAIMAIGITVRAITDGWTRILYGSGHIKRYAWLVISGGVFNVGLATLLCVILPREGESGGLAVLGPTIAFSTAYVIFHLVSLPIVISRCYSVTIWSVISPALPSLLISIAAAPVLYLDRFMPSHDLVNVGVAGGLYGVLVCAGYWAFGMTGQERRRLARAPRKLLDKRAERRAGKRNGGRSDA